KIIRKRRQSNTEGARRKVSAARFFGAADEWPARNSRKGSGAGAVRSRPGRGDRAPAVRGRSVVDRGEVPGRDELRAAPLGGERFRRGVLHAVEHDEDVRAREGRDV